MKGNEAKKNEVKETRGPDEQNVVEIRPENRPMGRFRNNPWMIASIVLGLVLVGVISFGGGGGISGNVVSESVASDNLVAFIKSQGQGGDIEINSIEREGALYKAVVDYQGQQIPVYISLDGKYLIADVIPLAGDSGGPAVVSDVEIGDSPIMGDKNAPVTIVEFSDYQCPFCAKFFLETLLSLEKEYINKGMVKLVYKDFPLNIHPEAPKAAEAARCVREQKGDDGYFKMHDLMFKNQNELGMENYKKWARMLGVSAAKFDDCLESGKYTEEVQSDLAYGSQLGVSGTPAFFINGKLISGAQPFDVFKQIIDAELANSGV